jgi:hypothetical protein
MESEPAFPGDGGVECFFVWLQLGTRTGPIAHGKAVRSAQVLEDEAPVRAGEVDLGTPRRGKVANFVQGMSTALIPS